MKIFKRSALLGSRRCCLIFAVLLISASCKQSTDNAGPENSDQKTSNVTTEAIPFSVGDVISLKGVNGKFVSGKEGFSAMICNVTTATALEKFTVIDAGGGKIALRSKAKYTSSENGTQAMNCNRTSVGEQEKFTVISNADGTISLKGNNNKYVSSENGTQAMNCNRAAIDGWEKFTVVNYTSTPPGNEVWRIANLTNFESYPDPNSDECINYNGCLWAGQFAFVNGVQPLSWVQANNIIAIHSKDAGQYQLKTFRLRQGNKTIDAKVYDMCSDSDCNGCCTINANQNGAGFLIDVEKFTMQRFGTGSGIVEWRCLDCN